MKYILSFFIAAASLCRFAGAGLSAAGHPPVNIKAAFSVFSPAKSSFTLKYAPLQNLSFYAGNLSFGGLWGSFSSSAPVSPQPLKKAAASSEVFYTSYADTGLFPLYIAADAGFADIKTSVFIGFEKSASAEKLFPSSLADYSLRAGAALFSPLHYRHSRKRFPALHPMRVDFRMEKKLYRLQPAGKLVFAAAAFCLLLRRHSDSAPARLRRAKPFFAASKLYGQSVRNALVFGTIRRGAKVRLFFVQCACLFLYVRLFKPKRFV